MYWRCRSAIGLVSARVHRNTHRPPSTTAATADDVGVPRAPKRTIVRRRRHHTDSITPGAASS
ncbi:hypothetical protein NY08_1236 [Rhodococcus sp. B7740]|nr:hypothetical protein NY08_1236 [Rhodococcus sp. B7740]